MSGTTLSVVIPCYNEEATLADCVAAVEAIADQDLSLEIIIVDDASSDDSCAIAGRLASQYGNIELIRHSDNQGKGAALRSGFQKATGQFVAVQDADLEYDPRDLRKLLRPLQEGLADVVLGSRFLTTESRRVLYYWHSLGNRFLTLLSNMFTDLNLSDMETCYKLFRRELIQSIDIQENRFGFEPEVVAKIAEMRCRVYEMGISYRGRTYEEGKKIGLRDGFRALYCIVRYNAHRAPLPIQFMFYILIGGAAAIVNLLTFLMLRNLETPLLTATLVSFGIAAAVNYYLCIKTIFRHRAKWDTLAEIAIYLLVVAAGAGVDAATTLGLSNSGLSEWLSKLAGTLAALLVNFAGRRFFVFPEARRGPWQASGRITPSE